jgi:hypothetical protein
MKSFFSYTIWPVFLFALMLALCFHVHAQTEPQKKQEEAKAAAPISPVLEQCTLEIENGRSVKPIFLSSRPLAHYSAGNLRVFLDKNTVSTRKLEALDDTIHWKAEAKPELQLVWLGTDAKVIYLAGIEPNNDKLVEKSGVSAKINLLEVESGKWLEELVLEKPEAKEIERVEALEVSNNQVVVLSAIRDNDKGFEGEGNLLRYRVSFFKDGGTRPLWSKTYTSAGVVARDGAALLWSSRSPEKARPSLQKLGFLGSDIIVCAGPVEPIVCLDASGKESWRTQKLWEFERGFIGPSVWQHVIGRNRKEDDEPAKDRKDAKPNRAEESGYANIVGGPIIVKSPQKDGGTSIFVAVAKAPSPRWAQYLADCTVYELNENGRPSAMANLPRMVLGGSFKVHKDGLVWACQNKAFVKLTMSENRLLGLGFGPGGPDCLCRVDWYRQLGATKADAWLQSDPAGNPVAMSVTHAFRVVTGGYVTNPKTKIYQFPIAVVDLKNGAAREIVLKVTYSGDMPKPESNFRHSEAASGKDRYETRGPYLLAITWLEIEGSRLRVHLGMENWTRSLVFDIDDLLTRS